MKMKRLVKNNNNSESFYFRTNSDRQVLLNFLQQGRRSNVAHKT